ncbi:hypothetical protein scyTo_0000298 [Scyliorhinus torazame]|uniref:Uncharacterized protein n=1 Tax=Scyliorhinus torazame TaxID=75743 RepID=A0A401NUU3_SCYTO|nr:hypothetical protein [Scyliorhinus torazame]
MFVHADVRLVAEVNGELVHLCGSWGLECAPTCRSVEIVLEQVQQGKKVLSLQIASYVPSRAPCCELLLTPADMWHGRSLLFVAGRGKIERSLCQLQPQSSRQSIRIQTSRSTGRWHLLGLQLYSVAPEGKE